MIVKQIMEKYTVNIENVVEFETESSAEIYECTDLKDARDVIDDIKQLKEFLGDIKNGK